MAATGNAKMVKKSDKFICQCGGNIKNGTRAVGGKKTYYSRCDKCGIEHRKVSEFTLKMD